MFAWDPRPRVKRQRLDGQAFTVNPFFQFQQKNFKFFLFLQKMQVSRVTRQSSFVEIQSVVDSSTFAERIPP
jgi:hypothetical protein